MSVNLLTDFQGNQLSLANDNLLINSDFRNPINQRRQTSYTADATYNKVYSVDRWAVTFRGKVTVNDGYITVENTNTNPGAAQVEAYFVQQFENTLNDDLVLQVKVKSITGDVKVFGYALEVGLNVFASDSSTSRGNITFVIGYGASVELEYIKLEYGTVATPLIPRPYAYELLLCQRYGYDVLNGSSTYGYVGDGIRIPGNLGRIWIDIPIAMRTIPTLEANGTFQLFNGTSTEVNITSFYLTNLFCSSNKISINIPNLSSYEEGDYLTMRVSNNASASFFLDAEIK